MPDIRGLLADPEFNSLDTATQKTILSRVDPDFGGLSDEDYQNFRQKINVNHVGLDPERGWWAHLKSIWPTADSVLSQSPVDLVKGIVGTPHMEEYMRNPTVLNNLKAIPILGNIVAMLAKPYETAKTGDIAGSFADAVNVAAMFAPEVLTGAETGTLLPRSAAEAASEPIGPGAPKGTTGKMGIGDVTKAAYNITKVANGNPYSALSGAAGLYAQAKKALGAKLDTVTPAEIDATKAYLDKMTTQGGEDFPLPPSNAKHPYSSPTLSPGIDYRGPDFPVGSRSVSPNPGKPIEQPTPPNAPTPSGKRTYSSPNLSVDIAHSGPDFDVPRTTTPNSSLPTPPEGQISTAAGTPGTPTPYEPAYPLQGGGLSPKDANIKGARTVKARALANHARINSLDPNTWSDTDWAREADRAGVNPPNSPESKALAIEEFNKMAKKTPAPTPKAPEAPPTPTPQPVAPSPTKVPAKKKAAAASATPASPVPSAPSPGALPEEGTSFALKTPVGKLPAGSRVYYWGQSADGSHSVMSDTNPAIRNFENVSEDDLRKAFGR